MGLYPKALSEYLALIGIPRGPNSKIYFVDPLSGGSGNDSNTGVSLSSPLATVQAAEDKCVTNRNDCVVMLGGPTASAVAAEINWDKDYTHLVGLSGDLSVGQRCRVTGSAAVDAVQVLHITGNGCIFRNIAVKNEANADADNGAVLLTGDRCYFKNCEFSGMLDATPAARAGSFSFKMTGAAENTFENCSIGATTIVRAAANAELVMTAASIRNTFRQCKFLAYSETAGKFMVSIDNSGTQSCGINWFENCQFFSQSVNWLTPIDNCFSIGAGGTHYTVVVGGETILVGIDGWADDTTYMYHNLHTPTNVGGIPVQWTT